MIYAVIDVGSNSVRMMVHDGVKTISKQVIVTQLASGLIKTGQLSCEAVERTVRAVSFFVSKAKRLKINNVMIFATASVRNATNGKVFVDEVKNRLGLDVDVISGETEAQINLLGVLAGKDGGVIDVGGASTEIAVVLNGKRVYLKSVSWGACTLTDYCGPSQESVDRKVSLIVSEYGNIPYANFTAVGGTATSIASMLLELREYSAERVDGFTFSKQQLFNLKNKLFLMTEKERENIVGLMPERAKVIACGVALLYGIMDKINLNFLTVSERDNLEGYLSLKGLVKND